jgi:uncharacterized membrane protein YbaN (DUF454 family)
MSFFFSNFVLHQILTKIMERKGLTKSQKVCFILLWVVLCIMMFTLPSDKSMAEKIGVAVVSGIIIVIGINVKPKTMNGRNRR